MGRDSRPSTQVEVTAAVAEGISQDEADERRAAEAVRAREPPSGHPARLWRPVGELRGVGVRCAADEAELHEKMLATPPGRTWTTYDRSSSPYGCRSALVHAPD
ncbi:MULTISPECIES: muconolactone Delta-isomerase family protein [unclassified Streptomyces]|uniref:muconolactone Delta-isomerase family protein n=1 Tax=unclassified Streptomyces TaxID=2593676 RepID=UPI0038218DE3